MTDERVKEPGTRSRVSVTQAASRRGTRQTTPKRSRAGYPVSERVSNSLLRRFDRWFSSSAGVWQTAIVTLAIVAVELARPTIDPHGFWLLFALTVYSGITQPALAHTGSETAELLKRLLEKIEDLEEEELQQLKTLLKGRSDAQ